MFEAVQLNAVDGGDKVIHGLHLRSQRYHSRLFRTLLRRYHKGVFFQMLNDTSATTSFSTFASTIQSQRVGLLVHRLSIQSSVELFEILNN